MRLEGTLEELLFKNTSKMDEKEITIFQNFALKKVTITSSVVFALFFVALGIGLAFVNVALGVILIVCGCIGGFIFMPYLMKENVQKQNNDNLGDRKYLNTFEFYENQINVATEATTSKQSNDYKQIATQTLRYEDLYQLVIYKNHLFLYINPSQSFILNFNGMTKGTYQELIELIKSKNVKTIDKSGQSVPEEKK